MQEQNQKHYRNKSEKLQKIQNNGNESIENKNWINNQSYTKKIVKLYNKTEPWFINITIL